MNQRWSNRRDWKMSGKPKRSWTSGHSYAVKFSLFPLLGYFLSACREAWTPNRPRLWSAANLGPGHSANLPKHTDDKRMLITGDLFSHGTWNFLIIGGFASVKLYRFSVMTERAHLIGLYKYCTDAFPPNWQQKQRSEWSSISPEGRSGGILKFPGYMKGIKSKQAQAKIGV